MIQIPLTQGKVARVSKMDIEYANLTWFATKCVGKTSRFYAKRWFAGPGGRMQVSLHQLIYSDMVASGLRRPLRPGEQVDHANNDSLDNRRCNLRPATMSQQQVNANKIRSNNTSGQRGVWRSGNRWDTRIRVRGERICLGTYDTIEEAARVYDRAAIKHHGDRAVLNFPSSDHP